MSSVNKNKHSDLKLVPETVLKKRHDLDEMRAKKQFLEMTAPRGNRKVFSSSKKKIKVRKPETFIANARMRKHHMQRYKRVKKKGMQKRASDKKLTATRVEQDDNDDDETTTTTPPRTLAYSANSVGSPFVFAVRVRDALGVPRHVTMALRTLRLGTVHTGVFLRYDGDASVRKLLHLVEPFVVYGVPSRAVVADMIVRRGRAKVDGALTPLSDNVVVEKALGEETGIICLEDLVHAITSSSTTTSLFQRAVSFLAPFQLTAPKSKFQKKTLNDKEDTKNYGDKGDLMDEYIKQML